MIAPDDLDLEIRSLVDLAGADAPPAPNLKLGRRVPGHTWPTRRTIGAAAALILVVGLCLCFVGLFVAVPVTTIATAYGYLRFQDRPVL